MTSSIIAKVNALQDNHVVNAIFFVGDSVCFSRGFDYKDLTSNEGVSVVQSAHDLSQSIALSKKVTISVLSGLSSGASLGIFSPSQFRLATPSSRFQLSEIASGVLPLGGMSFAFCSRAETPSVGAAIGRYAAASQQVFDAMDLYYTGLATHVVAEECEDTLAQALGRTLSEEDTKKRVQMPGMRLESIAEMIEDMHIDCDLDPLDDVIWEQFM
jgi:enoyl-CoA hydratase/carnithine racemase